MDAHGLDEADLPQQGFITTADIEKLLADRQRRQLSGGIFDLVDGIDIRGITFPECSAVCGSIRPAGSGRPAVRFIMASRSASYHWLSAPAAPAARARRSTTVRAA